MKENIEVKFRTPVQEDPAATDPKQIELARQELLKLDTESKLFIAPNYPNKGEYEVLKDHLFESRPELDGKSVYEYFDKIILGHGQGPTETGQRTFKNTDNLGEEFQGTLSDITARETQSGQKVLTVVCGTEQTDKMTITRAIKQYLSSNKK